MDQSNLHRKEKGFSTFSLKKFLFSWGKSKKVLKSQVSTQSRTQGGTDNDDYEPHLNKETLKQGTVPSIAAGEPVPSTTVSIRHIFTSDKKHESSINTSLRPHVPVALSFSSTSQSDLPRTSMKKPTRKSLRSKRLKDQSSDTSLREKLIRGFEKQIKSDQFRRQRRNQIMHTEGGDDLSSEVSEEKPKEKVDEHRRRSAFENRPIVEDLGADIALNHPSFHRINRMMTLTNVRETDEEKLNWLWERTRINFLFGESTLDPDKVNTAMSKAALAGVDWKSSGRKFQDSSRRLSNPEGRPHLSPLVRGSGSLLFKPSKTRHWPN